MARATDRAVSDSPDDLLELLLLPGTVARILESHDLLHEILETVDLSVCAPGDGFQGGDDFFCWLFLEAIFVVGFGIRLPPPVPGCSLVRGADERKMPIGIFLSLSRLCRATVVFRVFHRITVGCEFL